MPEQKTLRTIRSFVRREGRLTPGQQRAINELWAQFALDEGDDLLDLNQLFNRKAPKVIEIGFGNGASLAEMAKSKPDTDFLGIEVHRPGVGQLLNLIDKNGLSNLRVACTDAVELLKHRIADNSLDRLQLFFPDPWHKKRHHKRRIIQPDFVKLLAKKIKLGGHLHMATDWQHYAEQMLTDFSDNTNFKNCADDKYIPRPDYRPLTKFEHRGQKLGHGIWDLLYKRH
ncbi:MAG: tRNA (guanosine(46)-N7)-methyltransferase TrmB [Methylophagaceae bacterium]|jgi:tRNA (guanine-N7-)-methyltransferase|tara:strand:- start:773 stop:1456 length:684 start_codon:yes stop_codon:yes gene_type:complete